MMPHKYPHLVLIFFIAAGLAVELLPPRTRDTWVAARAVIAAADAGAASAHPVGPAAVPNPVSRATPAVPAGRPGAAEAVAKAAAPLVPPPLSVSFIVPSGTQCVPH